MATSETTICLLISYINQCKLKGHLMESWKIFINCFIPCENWPNHIEKVTWHLPCSLGRCDIETIIPICFNTVFSWSSKVYQGITSTFVIINEIIIYIYIYVKSAYDAACMKYSTPQSEPLPKTPCFCNGKVQKCLQRNQKFVQILCLFSLRRKQFPHSPLNVVV